MYDVRFCESFTASESISRVAKLVLRGNCARCSRVLRNHQSSADKLSSAQELTCTFVCDAIGWAIRMAMAKDSIH